MLKAGIISLGCPRNLIDSELIAGSLKKSGMKIVDPDKGADICIVNTCAFTGPARQESIDRILEVVQAKKEGRIKYLVVSGCLPQLYKAKLSKELREADLLIGTNDFLKLPALVKKLKVRGAPRTFVSSSLNYIYDEKDPRITLTPAHYAYIKISEGCSNLCSYCIIPRLRGKFRSRPIESIEAEFEKLSRSGALKEVNLIGQDTTFYGSDIYGKIRFSELLRRLCRIKNSVRWIRVLYTHPAHYSDELIDTVRDEDRICKYLDIPIQHISDKMLYGMNRRIGKEDIKRLVDKLRKRVPGLALRTSVIVGFPGEGERDFRQLMDFIKETRFERLGAFIYSREEGTKAARIKGQVPENIKEARFDAVMKLQQSISSEINRGWVGKTMDVLIDDKIIGEKNGYEARSEKDAPEIDGTVYVSGTSLKPGAFCRVKITGSMEYDLMGKKQ